MEFSVRSSASFAASAIESGYSDFPTCYILRLGVRSHHIHRECICDLHTNSDSAPRRLSSVLSASEPHLIPQVIQKMEIADAVTVAHLVHSLSCKFISQQRPDYI